MTDWNLLSLAMAVIKRLPVCLELMFILLSMAANSFLAEMCDPSRVQKRRGKKTGG